MSLESVVKHFRKTDLSGAEIETLIGKTPVLYSELGQFKNINQLLGKEGYHVILLQTSSVSTGHWVAVTRNDNTGIIRYNDSYGFQLPEERQYTPYDQALPMYLTKLMEGHQVEHNTVDYQSKNKGVSTCGRFASMFCKFRNLSLLQIKELYTMNQTPYFKDADNIVCLLTLVGLDNITDYLTSIPRGNNP
jgi:hypothetical protein